MEATTAGPPDLPPPSKKHKLQPTSVPHTTFTTTIRSLPYTYIHLSLLSPSTLFKPAASLPDVDILTGRTHLTSALNQFLGITGTAIAIDILKVEGRDCWIRVPREDGQAVLKAMTAWTGDGVAWRVRRSGGWLGGVVGGSGRELFEN